MKTIKVKIKGRTPLLMSRYNIEEQLARKVGRATTKTYDIDEEAENSAYWKSTGKKKELMIPAQCIYSSMLNASSFHKIGKRSARSILAGSIRIEPEEIGLGTAKYVKDIRAVVIQKARVPKSRAKVEKWEVEFDIIYNEKLIADAQIIKTILEQAGERIGLMDYRPAKSGYFGTFEVVQFNPEK